jgi:hypothetical protein
LRVAESPQKGFSLFRLLLLLITRTLWYICTMFANKEIPASSRVPSYLKELEYLYARRLAIDTLIESLKEYDRYRVPRQGESELQTA